MSNKLVLITILAAFLKISKVHLSEVDLALNGDEDEMEMDRRTGRIDQKLRWPKNEEGKVIVPVSLANRDDWGESSVIESCELFLTVNIKNTQGPEHWTL